MQMATPITLVDSVRAGEGAGTGAGAAAQALGGSAQRSPGAQRIEFNGGQSVLVDTTSSQGRVWAQVLESLGRNGQPAYIEIDPTDRSLTRLLLPLVVKVVAIQPAADGVEVELEISHARHVLRNSQPEYQRLLAALQAAKAAATWVAVTETPQDHEIFDVRPWSAGAALAGQADPAAPADSANPAVPADEGDSGALALVSLAQAQRMFDLMNNRVCCPAGASSPCITFGYPDDGCWGRAHEMWRLMALEGVRADKVWIYGGLRVATRNHPSCEVRWGWHVAPTLQVDLGGGRSGTYVIDPSLFPGPVPRATWAGVQGDPAALLVPSAGSVFHRSRSGVVTLDPSYSETNMVLNRYRNDLRLRATGSNGPPPYLSCIPAEPGVQFRGAVPAGATHTWFTFGWPANWHVLWTVMPLTTCPGAPALRWRTRVERASTTAATYWIAVTNTSSAAVRFEARYQVLSR